MHAIAKMLKNMDRKPQVKLTKWESGERAITISLPAEEGATTAPLFWGLRKALKRVGVNNHYISNAPISKRAARKSDELLLRAIRGSLPRDSADLKTEWEPRRNRTAEQQCSPDKQLERRQGPLKGIIWIPDYLPKTTLKQKLTIGNLYSALKHAGFKETALRWPKTN